MTLVALRHRRAFDRLRFTALGTGAALALALSAFAPSAAHAGTIVLEEHVSNGVLDLVWHPGFGTPRKLEPATLDAAHPAYANPSGDHTVGVLTNAIPDSGGIALSVVDPNGLADYTWEGWFFTGDGNTRRGLVLRASPGDDFMSAYQFVLNAGLVNLVFRKLVGQTPTTLATWLTPTLPGGTPAVNTWHHLKVAAHGNEFRCWFDGNEVTAAPIVDNASPLLTGWVGTYNFRFDLGNVPVYFDDLILRDPDSVPARSVSFGEMKARYR
jgi:hypothetical protein